MSKNELMAIKAALICAQETIQYLGAENYPSSTYFEDKEIEEMFYGLNSMILKLFEKIEAETV